MNCYSITETLYVVYLLLYIITCSVRLVDVDDWLTLVILLQICHTRALHVYFPSVSVYIFILRLI